MIRVRFAPSPTGYLHIGNARTALFNWLFARKNNGTFGLRIEDTDIERSQESFIEQIMSDLRWLGLRWDEGPDIGGEFGPYRQSDRFAIYQMYAKRLLEKGVAYYCYCTAEELEARRKEALELGQNPRYDNRCRSLSPAQKARFQKEGRAPAIRFKVKEGMITVRDLIRGEVSFDTSLIGDFVIMKSDGTPSFNFAVTVDDCLMKISHVIRGEDHLSNTPKHLMLFEALGFEPPLFAHMSMTLGPDGQRLSKRIQATSISQYRELGYLPEAIVNYLALLGWSPPGGKEILSIEEMIGQFEIERMTKSACIFDLEKLNWISGNYIRGADLDRVTNLAIGYLKRDRLISGQISQKRYEWLKGMVNAVRDHLTYLSEITGYVDVFFKEEVKIEDKEARAILAKRRSKEVLQILTAELEKIEKIDESGFGVMMKELESKTETRGKELYLPIRAALTGKVRGPELVFILPILGRQRCIKRLRNAISVK